MNSHPFFTHLSGEEPENNYFSYELSVVIDIDHGKFSAKNIDVHFLNIDEFNSKFEKFISNRELIAKLECTYDSFIEFLKDRNATYVNFKIGDSFCGSKVVNYRLEGSIEISPENLFKYQQQFISLVVNI